VFPARYELNSYIVFRKRLVSKRLISPFLSDFQLAVPQMQFAYSVYCDVALLTATIN
jgi:hypothetical protein